MKKLFEKFLPKKESSKSYQERSPRVRLLLGDGAVLTASQKSFPILNLSETGLAFQSSGEDFSGQISATLTLDGSSLPVELEVARKGVGEIGAKFIGNPTPVRALLRKCFMDEIHASSMSEVDSERALPESNGKPRWFYAPGNYELFLVEVNQQVVRFEMEWAGKVLSVGPETGTRFGLIREEDRIKPSHAKANIIEWQLEVDDIQKKKAVRILENISNLDNTVREQLLKLLRN